MSFKIYRTAKVRVSDVSKLLQVSRVTASMWFNDHSQPHRLIEKRVEKLTLAVTAAVSAGDLPVSDDVPRAERFSKIKQVITAHLKKLSLGSIDE